MKFAKLPHATEPEYRPRGSSKIFIVALGDVSQHQLLKRLETDVGLEVGGCFIGNLKPDDATKCFDELKKYLPESRIVSVPLAAEGKLTGGSKDIQKVLDHRHIYKERLNSGITKSIDIILREGITILEVWCSSGGHSIITIEALLKLQKVVTYSKVILMEATETLARRNEPELLSFFVKWAKQNYENQFFYARCDESSNVDYGITVGISTTYGTGTIDYTDCFSCLTVVEGLKEKLPQCFEMNTVCDKYDLYSYFIFWSRQNLEKTQRRVALALDTLKLTSKSLVVLSGNIVSDFMEEERGRLYDEYDGIRPEIRQFDRILMNRENDLEFNFVITKFELLTDQSGETPTVDALFKKMEEMP
ncbi:MAG: hypothetical protein ACRDFB_11070 [Rhabdochlamydiaceae bacterium]